MIGILLATAIRMIIGTLWYHPSLFGKEWLRLSQLSEDQLRPSALAMIGAFVTALITATILSVFVHSISPLTWQNGAFVGFLAWLGFVATSSFGGVLFSKIPLKLWLLHRGDDLVSYLLMGTILALF